MATPRTISGQAALSALRPHIRRALEPTILAIEAEAIAPWAEAIGQTDQVLAALARLDPGSDWDVEMRRDLVRRAGEIRRALATLRSDQPDR